MKAYKIYLHYKHLVLKGHRTHHYNVCCQAKLQVLLYASVLQHKVNINNYNDQ
jgi:hypothetical protein